MNPRITKWIALTLACVASFCCSVEAFAATPSSGNKPSLGVTFSKQSLLGALVVDVYPGSPAQNAGLRPGDRILEVNGREITDYEEAVHAVKAGGNNSEINLLIARAGHKMVIHPLLGKWKPGAGVPSLTPTVMPPMMYAEPGSWFTESQNEPWFRLNPADLDDQHAYGG